MKQFNFALLGHPIARSISPSLYYYFYPSLPYVGKYYLFSTKHAVHLQELFGRYHMAGVNVTSPLKRVFLAQMDVETPEVRATGALNTITHREGKLWGHNTDVEGVRHMIEAQDICLRGQRVALLGAGGAAASVLYMLQRYEAEVYLLNRSPQKGKSLAKRFGVRYVEEGEKGLADCAILFSCLPPQSKVPTLPWENFSYVFDAAYYFSPVAQYTQGKRARYISGYQWLFYQALATYEFVMQSDLRGYTFQHWFEHRLQIPLQMEGDPQYDNKLSSSPVVSLVPLGLDSVDSQFILQHERQNIL